MKIDLEALQRDPYPIYSWLRDQHPVAWVDQLQLWLVTRWDDVVELEDTDRFSAEIPDSPLTRTIGANMLHQDGARHLRLRDVVAPTLRPAQLRAWVERVVPEIAVELLEALPEDATVDLVANYAEPLAVRALAELIGLNGLPFTDLCAWFNDIGAGAANFARDPEIHRAAEAACAALDAAVTPLLDQPPNGRPGTLIASMLAQKHTSSLTREEMLATIKLMIIGGMQESRDLIGTGLQVLLELPGVQEQLRRDERLIPRHIEECLRWNSPVGTITRRVRRGTTLGEVDLPEGAIIGGVLASANRDPRRWHDPDNFSLQRDERPHLAFARGPHSCVGAGLARLIGKLALEAFLATTMTASPVGPNTQRGWEFRGPAALAAVVSF